jgi:hypothetical protein
LPGRSDRRQELKQHEDDMEVTFFATPAGQLAGIVTELNRKLRCYYEYYGLTFNSRQLGRCYDEVKHLLYKRTNRGGGKRLTWEAFNRNG